MSDDPFEDPADTREEILAATYRALRTHGYADLTINAIGDEFEKSTSLVYRHYDGKDELVLECLSFMLERFERRMTDEDIADPRRRLEAFLEWGLDEEMPPARRKMVATLIELRSRAVHDGDYTDHFTKSDAVFEAHVADIVRSGIDQGEFRECDPDRVAATLVTMLTGVMFRRSTHESGDWLEDVRTEIEAYLDATVYSE
ncbi:TetR/AcrR family transcriptional regulator [Natrarchaeobius chitinivorans]|uniref:TetR family transcriptional regulator n=1 Tax=Natrarchaeobius chitinivorans TaxID=1679083 RepID=A0A3N6MKL7_NATCH|nr:TetR/AcrR family transcriptional regulator [Natrarchaeobius chitinivorans]RQG97780.1 TetR family transcriptional regulator [Natrarchaeobius chitinivorans]